PDVPHYDKLIVYLFPKQKLIYGPRQVDARIDQDSAISQQLTLWSQRGSQAIRGSLLAIPIEDALLYVQPLYLSASEGALPELRRVIVAYGNQLRMDTNLEAALEGIFGSGAAPSAVGARRAVPLQPATFTTQPPSALAKQALEHFTRAQAALRDQDWTRYGDELKKMRAVLEELAKKEGCVISAWEAWRRRSGSRVRPAASPPTQSQLGLLVARRARRRAGRALRKGHV